MDRALAAFVGSVGSGERGACVPVAGLGLGIRLLFRLFDIWKPGPVGWADRRGDAVGVMLDDVIAGIFAAAIVTVMAGVAHGWF